MTAHSLRTSRDTRCDYLHNQHRFLGSHDDRRLDLVEPTPTMPTTGPVQTCNISHVPIKLCDRRQHCRLGTQKLVTRCPALPTCMVLHAQHFYGTTCPRLVWHYLPKSTFVQCREAIIVLHGSHLVTFQ